jgi:L-lysine 2,3-aminomutase
MVLHANHARELSPALAAALLPFRRAGVTLLNQAVLLRGVNDSVSAQRELATQLHSHGVLPYYLHLLDRVQGTAHFEVPEAEALALRDAIHARLPGYLVPRLVREIPGEPGKTPA